MNKESLLFKKKSKKWKKRSLMNKLKNSPQISQTEEHLQTEKQGFFHI